MQLHQPLREVDLLGAVQGGHVAGGDRRAHGVIHLRLAVPQDVRADAHDGHVQIFASVEIPHPAALRLAEIGGPLLRQKHLGTLGQEHVAAGNDALGALPQLLPGSLARAFIPEQMLVRGKPLGMFPRERENLDPAEVAAGVKVLEHAAHHFKVLGFIDRPSRG